MQVTTYSTGTVQSWQIVAGEWPKYGFRGKTLNLIEPFATVCVIIIFRVPTSHPATLGCFVSVIVRKMLLFSSLLLWRVPLLPVRRAIVWDVNVMTQRKGMKLLLTPGHNSVRGFTVVRCAHCIQAWRLDSAV